MFSSQLTRCFTENVVNVFREVSHVKLVSAMIAIHYKVVKIELLRLRNDLNSGLELRFLKLITTTLRNKEQQINEISSFKS